MAYLTHHILDILTDGSGNATVYTAELVNGFVHAIRYVPDGTSPLDTGADLTITGEASGIAILTATDIGTSAVTWYPRAATVSTAAAAALYAAGGAAVNDRIPVATERIKVAVAQGAGAKAGRLHIYVGG